MARQVKHRERYKAIILPGTHNHRRCAKSCVQGSCVLLVRLLQGVRNRWWIIFSLKAPKQNGTPDTHRALPSSSRNTRLAPSLIWPTVMSCSHASKKSTTRFLSEIRGSWLKPQHPPPPPFRTNRYLLSLPGFSRLSPNTFQVVTAHLRGNQSPSSSSSSSRMESSGAQSRTPEIAGPVTLVIPFDTADEVTAAPAAPAADASRSDGTRRGGSIRSAVRDGGRAQTWGVGMDSALLGANERATVAAADFAAAAAAGRRVARIPLQISFLALAYGGTAKELDATANGSGGGGIGDVDSGIVSMMTAGGGGGGTAANGHNGNHHDLATTKHQQLQQERHLAILPEGSGGRFEEERRTRWARWTGWTRWMRWTGWGGWGKNDGRTAVTASKSSVGTTLRGVRSGKTRQARRYTYNYEDSATGRGRAMGGAEKGGEHDTTAAFERPEEAEWALDLIFSGPRMPALVVDLWSPGSIFLRHVEVRFVMLRVFSGLGCCRPFT